MAVSDIRITIKLNINYDLLVQMVVDGDLTRQQLSIFMDTLKYVDPNTNLLDRGFTKAMVAEGKDKNRVNTVLRHLRDVGLLLDWDTRNKWGDIIKCYKVNPSVVKWDVDKD